MIFGIDPKKIVTDALFLTEPTRDHLSGVMKMLEAAFNKNQLWVMCQAFHPLLRSKGTVMLKMRSGGKRLCTEMSAIFMQSCTKAEMGRAIAMILCEPDNLRLYTDHLTEEQRELWRRVLVNVYVSVGEAKNILKTSNIITEERISYYRITKIAVPCLSLLSITQSLSALTSRYGYRERSTFVTVHPRLHPYFFQAFFPHAYEKEIGQAQLPGSNVTVCNFEAESVAKYHLVRTLVKAGELGMGAKGISQSDVKRVAKKVGLEEFPLEVGKMSVLRSCYYIETIALGQHVSGREQPDSKSCEKALRQLFVDRLKYFQEYLISLLFPHIKGLRQRFVEYNTLGSMIGVLLTTLREEPNVWLSFTDVLLRSFVTVDSTSLYSDYAPLVFNPANQTNNVELVNDFSNKVFAADSFVIEFGLTALQAMGFLLCSLGMAELVLSPLHRPESPFARAEHLRLTALGRYALGVDSEYEPPRIEQKAYFELDPDRLIIRSLIEPNPYAQLLGDTSVSVSKSRFETSPSSFLANCNSRDDVENKIAVFRQFISSELPPLWKQFFQSLLQHCNPLKADATPYMHYRLDPNNTELIRLITTDEHLRQLVVRAEGYLILVRQSDIRKFEGLLKKRGYLL